MELESKTLQIEKVVAGSASEATIKVTRAEAGPLRVLRRIQ